MGAPYRGEGVVISKRDLQLGKIALRAGMISKDQLTRCLALQKKLVKTKGKKVALGALLLKKEYLTQAQLEEIVKLHNEKPGNEPTASEMTAEATPSGESSGVTEEAEAPAAEEKKRPRKTERAARASRSGDDEGDAPATATTTKARSSRRARAEEVDEAKATPEAAGDDDEATKKKDRRASRADVRKVDDARKDEPKNGASARLDARRSKRARAEEAEDAAKELAEAPKRADAEDEPKKARKRPTESDVDPAVFQSAPEDAVDEDDRRLIACPECGKKYRVRQAQVGKRFGCRRCKNKVKVPKDLFSRPAAQDESGEKVDVEEFTLSSGDQTSDSGEGKAEAAAEPKGSVRTAAARAAVAIQRVQSAPSITELAKAAQSAQKKGLAPRTRFGAAQAITLFVCVGTLFGGAVGIMALKQRADSSAAAVEQERVNKEFAAWLVKLDAALEGVDAVIEKRSPIEIGSTLSELQTVSAAKSSLILSDNRERASAHEQSVKLPEKLRALQLARAEGFEAQGRAEDALDAWREVAAASKKDEALQQAYARKLIRARRIPAAAAALEPFTSDAMRALRGYALERGDDGAKAGKAYGEVKDALGPLLVARAAIVDRSYDRAVEALGRASGLEGQAAAAAKVLEGYALELKGDPAGAERALREAAEAAKDTTPFGRIALGELLLRLGRAEHALTELQAGNLIAGSARGFLAIGDAYACQLDLDRARTAYREAAAQPLVPNLKDAALLAPGGIDPFEAPHAPDPRASARGRLAALELAVGNVGQASREYAEALQLDPFDPETHAGLARIDLLSNNLSTCQNRLDGISKLIARHGGAEAECVRSATSARVLIVKGAFLIAHGRNQEAGEALNLASTLDKSLEPQASTLRGRMFEAAGHHTRAYESYADAARAEVQDGVLGGREYAAAARRFAEKPGEAAEQERVLAGVTAALAANPYHARAYLLRALVLVKQGKARQGLADLEQAVVLNKYLRDAYVARGFVYVRDLPEADQKREMIALAQTDFQTALKIEARQGGEKAETYCGVALAYFLQNDLLPALKAADRAIELDARYADGYRVRAIIRGRQGNKVGEAEDKKMHAELLKAP